MYFQTVLIKPASSACNMNCDYCFYCDEAKKREQASYGLMTEDTLKQVIRKALFQAEREICFAFQGGEPTLCGIPFFETALEYEKRFNRNRVRIQNVIQTNGLCLDEEWCRFLSENGFLVGLSVDGTKETHDRCRHTAAGEPTYDRVCRAAGLLEKYKVDYNILTVVNGYTASAIGQIYREYKRKGWNYQQYITCLDPLGEEPGNREYSLTAPEYGKFLNQLFELWYKDWRRGRQPYIRLFENYIGILMGYPPEACEQSGVCSIQGVVEADGSVYPCDFYVLDEYRLGSFHENKVSEFFEQDRGRAFVDESKRISEMCGSCEYYMLCRGGCRRTRVKEEGTDTYRSLFCESYRMFFGKNMDRLKEIAKFLKERGGTG